jgi:hypothetical protein
MCFWTGEARLYLFVLMAFVADMLGRLRRGLTLRRALGIVAVLFLLLFLGQFLAMGLDVAFLFGLDLGLITEVSALMIVLAVRGHVSTAAYAVRRGLLRLKPARRFLRRGVRRAFRSRSARPFLPPPPDEDPAVFALA